MRPRALLLLAALAAFGTTRAAAAERRWKVIAGYDYYFPSNSAEGLRSQLDALSIGLVEGGYDSTAYSVDAHGGTGARAGVLYPYADRVMLGATLGYVIGPTMNTDFNAYSTALGHGGLTISRAVNFVRLMGHVRVNLANAGRWSFDLDSGWGGGYGRVDQSCSAVGSLTCPFTTTTDTWFGFTWELSPSVALNLKNASLILAPHYAGFPHFKGSDNVPSIDWRSVGVLFGAAF